MKHQILVIDDDTSVRQSLKRVLEVSRQWEVHAANGAGGLEGLKKESFDLLLLDLDLPELKGWEILEYAIDFQPEMRIVLLTGLISQCAEGSFEGTDAVLEKPTDVPLLLQTLGQVLDEPREQRLSRIRSGSVKTSFSVHGAVASTMGSFSSGLPAKPTRRSAKPTEFPICDLSSFQTGCRSR